MIEKVEEVYLVITYIKNRNEDTMNKNEFALTPPMGWNSYDYYDTTVNEAQIRANADYMAAHLKEFGWEYIVVDIEWYAYRTGTMRERYQYIPFEQVEMDEYSRLLPCPERFPSSKDGKGFGPLAEYIHNLGLKFGIHIMRGIPRNAVHSHMKLLGTDRTANEIANPSSICPWNPDMYGLDLSQPESQLYYDSLMELYASWGVDFVKCDDICNYGKQEEIPLLYHAIQKCGRPIVLSLSPGPAQIDAAWYYEKYANMWRITNDFWDTWPLLLDMFDRCELWEKHVSMGCYPDCDMIPLGKLGKGFGEERETGFTKEEQITMMTLWCIFRSPLMLGCELTKLDDWTLSLLTNKEVLSLLSQSNNARQIQKDSKKAVWYSEDIVNNSFYIALFNLSDEEQVVSVSEEELNQNDFSSYRCKDLWTKEEFSKEEQYLSKKLPAHGASLIRFCK